MTGSSTTGHGTTGGLGHSDPTGPHDSHLSNKADPRVDSDRYGTAGNTTGAGGYGTGQYGETHGTTGSGLTGHSTTHNTTGSGLTGHNTTGHGTTGGLGGHSTTGHSTTGGLGSDTFGTSSHGVVAGSTRSDPSGPHDSKLANKLDPRVDSDQYGSAGNTATAGGYGTGQYGQHNTTGGGLTGHSTTHGTTGSGLTGHSNTHGTTGSGLTGNGSGLTGHSNTHTTGSGLTGTTGQSTTHGTTGGLGHSTGGYSDPSGPHDSHLGNKADPRVDSDRYGAAGNTTGTGGYGTTGHSTTGGIGGTSSGYNDGTLPPANMSESEMPRALKEPYSKAEPHSSVHDNQHSAGVNTHGTHDTHGSDVHGKPSLMDKLNPKKDADGDGKAGFMK